MPHADRRKPLLRDRRILTLASSAPVCELCGSVSRTLTANASSPGTGRGCLCIPMSGKSQPLRKLTLDQVAESVRLYQAGQSLRRVAEQMGVSRQAMHDLLKRRIPLRRGRVEALPRKKRTAIREKRLNGLRRYRAKATRITAAQVRAVKERDQVCQKCGQEGTDVDHVLPVGKGGQTEMPNLQLLCNPCHRQKTGNDWRGVSKKEVSSTSSESMSSVEASRSRAKTFPTPAKAQASTDHARVFGASLPDSFANYDPGTCSWRTSQLSLLEEWALFSQTWPRAGWVLSGVAYALPTLGRPINATEFGSSPTQWGTPTSRDWKDTGDMTYVPTNGLLGRQAIERQWPTPTSSDGTGGPGSSGRDGGENLRTAAGGSLNPEFVEWLMGFPTGWTEVD